MVIWWSLKPSFGATLKPIREVVSQTLHYAMAVSQLSPFDFEACLSRADPRWRRLGKDETVARYVQNFAASNSLPGLPDDFEDAFDRRAVLVRSYF